MVKKSGFSKAWAIKVSIVMNFHFLKDMVFRFFYSEFINSIYLFLNVGSLGTIGVNFHIYN